MSLLLSSAVHTIYMLPSTSVLQHKLTYGTYVIYVYINIFSFPVTVLSTFLDISYKSLHSIHLLMFFAEKRRGAHKPIESMCISITPSKWGTPSNGGNFFYPGKKSVSELSWDTTK